MVVWRAELKSPDMPLFLSKHGTSGRIGKRGEMNNERNEAYVQNSG